ncbi:hypothetical protein ACHWQZ_G000367 [Mnemiopsis leidyi]
MTALPQGVWSLKDALAMKDVQEKVQAEKYNKRSKRKKVIEIKDDEVEVNSREVKKRKPPNKPAPKPRTVASPISGNSEISSPEFEKPAKIKTRRPPKKRSPELSVDESTADDSPSSKKLPRETPSRKSPRIREKAITLSDSDESGPELLPVNTYRQPLKTTENTEPLTRAGSGKRRKVTKRLSPANKTKTMEETKKTIVGRGTNGGAATDMSSDFSASLKMTSGSSARANSASKSLQLAKKQTEKRVRKDPPKSETKEPEVIKIPDKLSAGKRKGNVTSKVVKIKKPAAPKKNQGPKKAGLKAPLPVNTTIANSIQKTKYTLEKILGSGGFGYIYIVTDESNKRKAVMKVEPQDNGPLFSEMHFYQRAGKTEMLQSWSKSHKLKYLGIPEMFGFGIHLYNNIKYRYLVMPLFEGDLLKKHQESNNKFSVSTTLLLCIRMLEALEYMHEAGYVHADIKSANILLKNNGKEVYLADFGLARKYVMEGAHKAYKEEPAKAHDGTKEFTSIDAHKGVQPSRRGDLQILGYCCINWLGGSLPWFSWDNCNDIRSEKVKYEKKSSELLEVSLGLANLSSKPWKAIKSYLNTSFSLSYEDTPHYSNILSSLRSGLSKSDAGYIIWS